MVINDPVVRVKSGSMSDEVFWAHERKDHLPKLIEFIVKGMFL